MSTTRNPKPDAPGRHVVLILSTDAVAAALLGALVETLGFMVRFYQPPEVPDEAFRREKPTVAMIDCNDPTMMTDEVLGRAKMRGISVIIFGSAAAMKSVRAAAREHQIDTLLMPAAIDALDESLRKAVQEAC